ncbi:hypothetical protein [Qipengyuania huizhouensis]|uniref:hypothetical protein n=1 Tax=Qipengyuania huizhouensis TaxID=2867245 RepID=UPI0017E81E0E|nr:hypothetical protein [Qipengyuania huizhouensis]MBA4763950.1 hypothetical protein [Erythrobacter sp.]MBX7459879.1 hypothetical protein [Qipengyuania huizhouensis]
MMLGLLSILFLIGFPAAVAAFLAYRISVELRTGRSYVFGYWTNREVQPRMFWFDIMLKAVGIVIFIYLPLSVVWTSVGSFVQ